jgi:hypothetical protein
MISWPSAATMSPSDRRIPGSSSTIRIFAARIELGTPFNGAANVPGLTQAGRRRSRQTSSRGQVDPQAPTVSIERLV